MENELLKIGAAYVRVSDERQDEYSPDSQLKKIREYAAREGYLIPDEYVFYDDGISGKSAKKRGDFNRMIAIAKEKNSPFDRIYVWKFSRFARNQEESMVYKNLLRKKGVTVVSVSEPIPEGAYGSLIERVIEWMDEFYLVNLGTEVMRGMTEKASRGEPICAPPFGYVIKDKKYYPDEASGAADIIREIFRRYANGEGLRQIASALNERGIKSQNGVPFENRKIEYIINNPCYIGKIRWSPDGTRSVSRRRWNNEAIMIVDGHHEPLISTELWEAVQAKLKLTKQLYPKHEKRESNVEFMLKGLVKCSACGSTLFASGYSGKRKERCLQCGNYARGTCSVSHGVVVSRLEEAFIEGLEKAIDEKSFNIIPMQPKSSKEDSSAPDFQKLIAIEERKLQRAKEAYLAEIDSLEQYSKNKADILARIDFLKAKSASEPPKTINLKAFASKALTVLKFIKSKSATPKAKNEALRTIINKVVYSKPTETLDIFFHDI